MSKIEDPETMKLRRQIVQSRSVSELSQISSVSDIPLPSRIEKLLASSTVERTPKKKKSQENVSATAEKDYSYLSPMAIHDTIYSTLPRSLKSEILVKSRVQTVDAIQKSRRDLVESKSVGELSQVNKISDLPIPSPIQNLWQQGKRMRADVAAGGDEDASSQCTG